MVLRYYQSCKYLLGYTLLFLLMKFTLLDVHVQLCGLFEIGSLRYKFSSKLSFEALKRNNSRKL